MIAADLAEVVLVEAAHRHRRRADPDAGRDRRRPLVERDGVAVDGDLHLVQPLLRVLARPFGVAEVDLHQVRVGAAREDLQPALLQRLGEHVGVPADLRLVLAERFRPRDLEARRLRRDRVLERPALHPGEDGTVDGLRVLLAAEDEPGARPGERLVRRRGDEVAVLDGIRVQPRRDESREVRHVAVEQRADLVGDLAELVRLDGARIRGAAADDQLRQVLLRQREHLVVVDHHRLARDAVVRDRVQASAEVDLQPVREVAAVVEAERQDRVARLQRRHVDRHVRLRARVRLDVRVLGAEQLLRAVDGELLDLVDHLAAAVIALPRVALGVLVRRHRADRLEHGRPREVLGRDQLDLAALPLELLAEQRGDVGIDLVEPRAREVLKGLLRDGHGESPLPGNAG